MALCARRSVSLSVRPARFYAHGFALVGRVVFGDALHNRVTFLFGRKRHIEASGVAFDLGRQTDLVAHEYYLPSALWVLDADVLQQPDRDRVLQVGVEVQQHIDAGLTHRANVLENVVRFGVVQLRFEVDIQPLQAVRDAPAKQRQVLFARPGNRDGSQQIEHARLITSLDHDDRGTRSQDQL